GDGVRMGLYGAHGVSADGRFVLAQAAQGDAALYPTAGGPPQPIPALGRDLVPIGWSDMPDVLYAWPAGRQRQIDAYRLDIVSGRRERWRTVGSSDPTGAPMILTMAVAPDGSRYVYGSDG